MKPDWIDVAGITVSGGAKLCPGCGRTGRACWGMPCRYLDYTLSRPLSALRAWCVTVGGTLVSRKDRTPGTETATEER